MERLNDLPAVTAGKCNSNWSIGSGTLLSTFHHYKEQLFIHAPMCQFTCVTMLVKLEIKHTLNLHPILT